MDLVSETHGRRNKIFQPIFWRGAPLKIEGKTSELRELLLHTTYNVSGTAWPLHWIWGVIY